MKDLRSIGILRVGLTLLWCLVTQWAMAQTTIDVNDLEKLKAVQPCSFAAGRASKSTVRIKNNLPNPIKVEIKGLVPLLGLGVELWSGTAWDTMITIVPQGERILDFNFDPSKRLEGRNSHTLAFHFRESVSGSVDGWSKPSMVFLPFEVQGVLKVLLDGRRISEQSALKFDYASDELPQPQTITLLNEGATSLFLASPIKAYSDSEAFEMRIEFKQGDQELRGGERIDATVKYNPRAGVTNAMDYLHVVDQKGDLQAKIKVHARLYAVKNDDDPIPPLPVVPTFAALSDLLEKPIVEPVAERNQDTLTVTFGISALTSKAATYYQLGKTNVVVLGDSNLSIHVQEGVQADATGKVSFKAKLPTGYVPHGERMQLTYEFLPLPRSAQGKPKSPRVEALVLKSTVPLQVPALEVISPVPSFEWVWWVLGVLGGLIAGAVLLRLYLARLQAPRPITTTDVFLTEESNN